MNLLDTDAVIERLREKRYEAGFISVVTLIEVLRGVGGERRARLKALLEETFGVLNLDNESISTYCRLYTELRERGKMVPDADLLIAATAISHDLSLKTGDGHFERLRPLGLKIIELEASAPPGLPCS